MARAALAWSLDELAKESGVPRRTIARFEADENVRPDAVAKLAQTFEREGVVFIERGVYVGGVVPPMEGR
jgi:transcriptional regulator with XRE-family HTH domain